MTSKPTELAITLATLPSRNDHHNNGWVCADEVRHRLTLFGFDCTTQQVASWLKRMAAADAPWVEVRDGWWPVKAYRVTRFGRTDIQNKLEMHPRTPWLVVERTGS